MRRNNQYTQTKTMGTQRYYKYFAFISYSRRDEKFAQRLQKFLMGYKLPTRLCKQYPDRPRNLRPIYRDETDPGEDHLNRELPGALELSKYLIVVCSVNSARPNREEKNWINEEVRAFVGLEEGNADRVIPVMLRQKGDGSTSKECTPEAVQELHLPVADVSDKGEERTFSDVAAKVLDLAPNDLWNCWGREQRKKRIVRRIFGGIAAVLAVAAGLWCWDYYVPHYGYYADYVEFNNIPQGVGKELTKEQIAKREIHYRFKRWRGRLRQVESLNSAGYPRVSSTLPGQEERPASIKLTYAENGRIEEQIYEDLHGNVVQIRTVYPSVIVFSKPEEGDEGGRRGTGRIGGAAFSLGWEDSFGNAVRQKNRNVERYGVKRDARGAVIEETFQNMYASPVCNVEGVWGRRYERGADGRMLSMTYIDEKGKAMTDKEGIMKRVYTYSAEGEVVKEEFFADEEGKRRACGANGCSYRELTWEGGNLVRVSYYGLDEKLCLHKEGYASVEWMYDERGNQTSASCYGVDGKPCVCEEGYARFEDTYDERGNQISESYYGLDGKLCACREGYARVERTCDERGNRTSQSYYGLDGKPCLHKDGNARVEWTYDERGNTTSQSYYGLDGEPCLIKEGYAQVECTYDKRGNRTSQSYYGVDGKPCLHKDGNARVEWTYDERGNQTSQSYYGLDGKPCMLEDGYARVEWTYDERGNTTSKSYYGPDGKPCLCRDGYARLEMTYDERGNATSENYYGKDGKPCTCRYGCARIGSMYDERGNMTSEKYYGLDGKPCVIEKGYARLECTYNERGNMTSVSYYGLDGKLRLSIHGYARVEWTYNERGNITSASYYGEDGRPCVIEDGYARVEWTYNERGNMTSASYYGPDWKPCLLEDGYARLEWTYDERGNTTSQSYYGLDGKTPCLHKDGYARIEKTCNERGNMTSASSYGLDGKPVNVGGFHRIEVTYDSEGELQEMRYYNAAGELIETVKNQ